MQKKKIFKLFLVIFFLAKSSLFFCQKSFESKEKTLISLLQGIRSADNDLLRDSIGKSLREEFISMLDIPGSFHYKFEGLNNYMSNIISPDKKLRIFNWNISHSDYSNTYFAFVQSYDKKNKTSTWYELLDNNDLEKQENKYLKPNKWIGCLYYDIIPVKKGKKTLYTVLGWSGLDKNIQQKLIDVISINSGKLRLGAPIFKTDVGTKKRFVVKYSREVKVSLKWRENESRIVFDHVIPRDPAMKGAYAFYGPDLSFDAFELTKDKWILHSDVDVRMGKTKNTYHDPRSKKEKRKDK